METYIQLSAATEKVIDALIASGSAADGFEYIYEILRSKDLVAYFSIRPYHNGFIRLPDDFWDDLRLTEFLGLYERDDEGGLATADVHKNCLIGRIYETIIGHEQNLTPTEIKDFAEKFGKIDDQINLYVLENDIDLHCEKLNPNVSSEKSISKRGPNEKDRGLPLFYAAIYISTYYHENHDFPPIKDIEFFLKSARGNMRHTRPQAEISTIMNEYADMKKRFLDIIADVEHRVGK